MLVAPQRRKRRGSGWLLFWGVVGAALGLLALMVYVGVGALDALLQPNAEGLRQVVGPLAEVMAGVLGLSLTVVAIVVQLASARYPARIVDLFMTDPINVGTFAFITASGVYVVTVPVVASAEPLPRAAAITALVLTIINFGVLLPYFGHVFSFLEPSNIITQIRERAWRAVDRVAAPGAKVGELELAEAQWNTSDALERIADNSMAAIGQSDRTLALHTVRTLEGFVCNDYLPRKPDLPQGWGRVPSEYLNTLAEEFLRDILENMAWLEAKVFMEYDRILRRALGEATEIVSQIASSTRVIGESALERGDFEVVAITTRFFNTYLRHSLNERDVRAAYNILYEYRRFAEVLLDGGYTDTGVKVVKHMIYYGRTSNSGGLPFVTVTVAHDVRVLCERAFVCAREHVHEMLRLFLTLDQASEDQGEEVALLGVRRAQSILGAFFLDQGVEELAEQIRFDMRDEPAVRLRRIRDEILSVDEHKFWEITDRGFNFDWVEPRLRPLIGAFFGPIIDRAEAREHARRRSEAERLASKSPP